jgi:hypothetical protein
MLLRENHRIERGSDGMLKLDGVTCQVSRCFPWSEPDRYFSLKDVEGKELLLVRELSELDLSSCEALRGALREAGFLFEIERIDSIKEELQLRVWKVRTRQGVRQFQTELESWPRKLPGGAILIKDISGDLFCIRNIGALNEKSQDLIWPFID